MTPQDYIVIRDTREKEGQGWTFNGYGSTKVETIDRALPTGDYTIKGMEDLLCIERKRSTGEIAANIVQKRFEKEIIRMLQFKYRFIICEFTFDDVMSFPVNSGIPKSKWKDLKVKNYFIKRMLMEYAVKYNIHILFAGNSGREMAMTIFKRVLENELQ